MNRVILLQRIKMKAAERGYSSERSLCVDAGLSADFLRNIRTGKTVSPKVENLQKLADHLNVSVDWLLGTPEREALPLKNADVVPLRSTADTVFEVDARAGMGGGGDALLVAEPDGDNGSVAGEAIIGEWSLPPDYLRAELRVAPGRTRIIEAIGDSMSPTILSGDRVMVNLADRIASPPGIFALWDGLGVVVKRLEHIPNTDPPMLVIASDNRVHRTYERTAEEVNIIGRVVWVARRL